MVAKSISVHHFEKVKFGAKQIIPEPQEHSTVAGHKLYRDQGGYYILRQQADSPTIIREDLPFQVGYAASLARDE
ncbi:hypothetical protein [Polynucleobacter antarcticus]|uniref:Uncharacterized protein n=1 Tax=Polynucleobacter antarcticus TaxID=1743162 RepID=A0A6M9PKA5_9BURK|nr:hypothetical protein [Polynucleobacter antarcticus]QKM62584.1 hypothetical protein DCO16_05580 [Polynucleobacter antarcticus]